MVTMYPGTFQLRCRGVMCLQVSKEQVTSAHLVCILPTDASIKLNPRVHSSIVTHLSQLAHLLHLVLDKLLAAKSRIHCIMQKSNAFTQNSSRTIDRRKKMRLLRSPSWQPQQQQRLWRGSELDAGSEHWKEQQGPSLHTS